MFEQSGETRSVFLKDWTIKSFLKMTSSCSAKCFCTIALVLWGSFLGTAQASTVRIKDIVDYEGVRDNQLVGYGIVVGLNGTGDRLTNTLFTRETLIGMLNRLGVNIRDKAIQLKTHNVAEIGRAHV